MTDLTIHNFTYLLIELDKNIKAIEECFEQERIALQKIHIIHNTMDKMCKNWKLKEKFQE